MGNRTIITIKDYSSVSSLGTIFDSLTCVPITMLNWLKCVFYCIIRKYWKSNYTFFVILSVVFCVFFLEAFAVVSNENLTEKQDSQYTQSYCRYWQRHVAII